MARTSTTKANASTKHPASRTLVLDVGAHSIKAGFASQDTNSNALSNDDCHIISNGIARSERDRRTYVGSELDDCQDFGQLTVRRPVERGYIVNWEGQKAIWESSILNNYDSGLACDPAETSLILTEAPHAPAALQRHADEMVFEEFGFDNYARVLGPILPAYACSTQIGQPAECLMVVDVGHSHTTLTPTLSGRPLHAACRRLDIGGKVLTHQFKDWVSSRSMALQKEFFLAEQMKEDVCYVVGSAQEFAASLEKCWTGGQNDPRKVDTSIVVEYMVPDYEALKRGYVRPHDSTRSRAELLGLDGNLREHYAVLGNERFTVPELLFSPSDIGMQSPGIPGMLLDSLETIPKGLWQAFLANILVIGGTSRLPGFVERLQAELRANVDERFFVQVKKAEDPLKSIWQGGVRIAQSPELMQEFCVSKDEYLEHGDTWTRRVFAGRKPR